MPEADRHAGGTRPAEFGAAQPRLWFTSSGRTCLIDADGKGLRTLEVDAPGQATWQPSGFLADGRVLLLSMEPRRDGPGRPFEGYYTQTPTRIWAYDLDRATPEELATRDRMAVFYTPQLLLRDGRVLMQVCRPGYSRIFNMRLDGSDARPFAGAAEGVAYGFSLSPDGTRIAYHLAGPDGYRIFTCDTEGDGLAPVAHDPDHLYFGPTWSPDGRWLLYQDCCHRADPGHDWSDLRLSRPDGSEHRMLTTGRAMWFAASYGYPGNRGGGSNGPVWTRDGQILFPRRLPDAKVPWEYQEHRPDTDHFNRDFRPERARGGTEVCRLDPSTGVLTVLTSSTPPVWDFRPCESPDGDLIAFCRAETGGVPGLWVMRADGSGRRLLTRGLDDSGADHPGWLP